MAEIRRAVNDVGVCQVKKGAGTLLRMYESMPNGDCLRVFSPRINKFFGERKLSHVFVPERWWEACLRKASHRLS